MKNNMHHDDPSTETHLSVQDEISRGLKPSVSFETFVFLLIFCAFFGYLGYRMGPIHLINTMISTAFDLLINTTFYIMAVAVLAGALGDVFTEFGVISFINVLLSPIIQPIYGLPGATLVGVFATYLSDNPAIIAFAKNQQFKHYFKKYQFPALTNIGTSFGMGFIVSAAIAGMAPEGTSYIRPILFGNLAAVVGSIISTRLMLYHASKKYALTETFEVEEGQEAYDILKYRKIRKGAIGTRLLAALLEGGKKGVDLGFDIIPGVLIVTTLIILLTNGAGPNGIYDGSPYQGIALIPALAEKIDFILTPLFGFQHFEAVSVPLTALGSAGAAVGLIPDLIAQKLANPHDIAVFVAMCMCYSGYLSTHIVMMETLGEDDLTGKAILSHTIGGIGAGVTAHLLMTFFG